MFGKHEESWSRKLNSGQRKKQYFMAGKYFLFLFEGKHFPLVTKKMTSSTVQNTNPSLSLSLSLKSLIEQLKHLSALLPGNFFFLMFYLCYVFILFIFNL